MLLINFKTYQQATGTNAVALAKVCEKVARESSVEIIPVVQGVDIYRVQQETKGKVYAQHIDSITAGAHTGHVVAEAIKNAGASGTLLNHAEHQLDLETITASIQRAKEAGLTTVVCIASYDMTEKIVALQPDYIAIEPPELIGGNISVSTAQPEIITKTVERAGGIPVLCGAGVKTAEDINKALEYGAKGILLASGVVKAEDPEATLRELIKGFS